MSYIVNQARVHTLTIGGVDYTSALISWNASDASANKNGFISTSGSLILGSYPGGPDVEDYDRNDFKRGIPVVLTMRKPNGSTYRHPRGLLYVVSTSYDVESEQLVVELGCRLALAAIMDDASTTLPLSPIPLDPAQQQIGNVSAAFAAAGKYLYQNNQGNLITGTFFDGDSTSGTAPGQWTSILGVTAISAAPLAGTGAIPDSVKLSYSIPEGSVANDQKGRIDSDEVISYYWIDYPASLSVRVNTDADDENPNGSLNNAGGTNPGSKPPANGNDPCGNTPDQPGDNGQGSCQEGYSVESRPWILPAIRIEETKSHYNGPGGQQDFTERVTYGPAVEANSQYYADDYAYCVGVYATNCQPGGSCPASGMQQVVLSRSTTRNYFGDANEVVETISEEWVNKLSMAQTQDWRSGLSSQGIPVDYRRISTGSLIRSSVTITQYYKENNANVQKTINYNSVGQNGSGIAVGSGKLDAYNGVQTMDIRRSTSTTTLDVAPDIVNTASTSTVTLESEIPLFTKRFVLPPAESGPYEIDEQVPVPILYTDKSDIDNILNTYTNYLVRFIKGDAFGLQIGEGLREDVAQNWFPGMPFRYYDPKKGKVLAMRMDATSWGVTGTESAFVTNGIWCGKSNGTVTLPENLVGNSIPSDGGSIDPITTDPNGPTAPAPPVVVPPVVDDETDVDSGTYAWVVKVNMSFGAQVQALDGIGVQPIWDGDGTVKHSQSMVAYCQGMVVENGGLISSTSSGGIPVEVNGSLVTQDAVVVTPDLFA